MFNQSTKHTMKNLILLNLFRVWAFGLSLMLAAGITYAIVQLATGNVSSTASFEF